MDSKKDRSGTTGYASGREHGATSMSRRDFSRLLVGAGAMLASSGMPFSALASDGTGQPKKGGRVRIALNSQGANDTFDGARALNPGDFLRSTAIFSYLTRQDENGRALPELAESFESSADGRQWTFKITRGVVYSDGSPLKMEDIAFSILRHKEDRVLSTVRQLAENFKSVRVDGPDTVVLELHEPDVDIPITLSTFPFTVVKDQTYDFRQPVGTGPFVVKEFAPGVRTLCTRNPKYWKSGRPYIDELEIFPIVDQVARANALLSGDVQMAVDIRGASIAQLQRSSEVQPFVTKASRYTSIQSAVNMAPGNDEHLRLALSYLMDRERVLKTVLLGNGVLGNDYPAIGGSPFSNDGLEQRRLDPDKAKFHLAKSGVGRGPVPVHVSEASAFSIDIGQILQREAAGIGLNLDLRKEPATSYWSVVAGKRPFFAMTINPRPTYNILLNMTWKTGAVFNFSHFSDARLDSLIDTARVTMDEAKRADLYREIDAVIYGSGALILPAFINYVDGLSNRVKGLRPIPIAPLGGCEFVDSIWLSS
ncbi:ABC transporter substrate-binding protein [Castellaniella sp.]|uniref:ABC transporter substrate-binding protein n=1 Tax=Castellaniella sp. TaxID=1955812 RepID=UPI003C769BD9